MASSPSAPSPSPPQSSQGDGGMAKMRGPPTKINLSAESEKGARGGAASADASVAGPVAAAFTAISSFPPPYPTPKSASTPLSLRSTSSDPQLWSVGTGGRTRPKSPPAAPTQGNDGSARVGANATGRTSSRGWDREKREGTPPLPTETAATGGPETQPGSGPSSVAPRPPSSSRSCRPHSVAKTPGGDVARRAGGELRRMGSGGPWRPSSSSSSSLSPRLFILSSEVSSQS
mmetsp:Transcript_51098/g.153556  ORF Transcript_51098/g.153556 Transcript_51098/m.153556 type:complete len:232 (+) Transcript_51098:982-1677(+)